MTPRLDDTNVPGLSRKLRDALNGAVDEHAAARDGLRDAVCAYYDALVAAGRPRGEIIGLIEGLVGAVQPPSAVAAFGDGRRKKLITEMIGWCRERRS